MQVNNRNSIGFKGYELEIEGFKKKNELLSSLSNIPTTAFVVKPVEEDGYAKGYVNPEIIADALAKSNLNRDKPFKKLVRREQISLAEHTIAANEIKQAILFDALGIKNKLTGKTAEILQDLAAKNKEN